MGIFGDIFNDIKEENSKRREAREYISQAKEYVRAGESIYEAAYDKVSAYASKTEYELKMHSEYKQKIAKELGGNIGKVLKNFEGFNIDSKVMEAPLVTAKSAELDMNLFNSIISRDITLLEVTSLFSFFASDEDYYEAKRQKNEAKRYKESMRRERERLYRYKEQMEEIRGFIFAEKNELESLMEKVRKMTSELDLGMEKSKFSKEEADYLKGIQKITEQVVNLLSTQFLTDSFSVTSKYQQVYDGIKKVNQSLPSVPSINDQTTIRAIKEILDGTVVY